VFSVLSVVEALLLTLKRETDSLISITSQYFYRS
jgi:hypothetical protein